MILSKKYVFDRISEVNGHFNDVKKVTARKGAYYSKY